MLTEQINDDDDDLERETRAANPTTDISWRGADGKS